MTPLNNQLTVSESLRVAVQLGQADIELVPGAIETLARELSRLEGGNDKGYPQSVLTAILAGDNVGVSDALTAMDFLYVHVRMASDRHHAAEAEKVRL